MSQEKSEPTDEPTTQAPMPDRQTQPVDAEAPPRLPFPVVGIGASAGGLEAVSEFLVDLRADSGMAYVFIQHLPPTGESMLAEILAKRTDVPVLQVEEGMAVEPNHLYVIRPGFTLTLDKGVFRLGERVTRPGNNRPVDDFFKSLAEEQRERAICIIMSGMGSNGTAGAQAVKAVGGLCIAQDPESTEYPSMPAHLIDAGYADYILRPKDMPAVLLDYAGHPYARGQREERADLAKRDQQHLREILAVLRTRTHQDFNGYKKPTVLRRVQRRMGLNRVTRLSDYAKLLRQTPSEVSALADDLLIHVTGFFRDAASWEALRERVIVPLIASRDNDESVRCWVTACSSGEEAYTLAILLVEEAERANKFLDIKVFATDMAERTLLAARGGIYPGGIESEIAPERLERFFEREDAVYRVRQEIRERVVFAPQNVLQDPPFSRLDIVSCRNLLIYLEPEVQARVLGLLHFGLREGGTLFLGTSETVSADDLFEPIDKQARIYRRIGPTRHGATDFPSPRAMGGRETADRGATGTRAVGARPSMAQMTTRALVDHHTPAAVTIDRDHRIVYYHGNTEPFIALQRGEPTRELFELARENVRGAIRVAIQRALAANAPATVRDGWLEVRPGRRARIAVTASPLDPKNAPDHLVISFREQGDVGVVADRAAAPAGVAAQAESELGRVREELQSTIEELRTSNEDLKASHEEVISTNEELQSTNEELETGREEMQSLNEELSTVNSQLRAKIEEHQAARNDLASLLTSTDIAVLFLDTQFRIRRYTAAVRELMEVIGTDIGRPLSDLAKKFDDPDLPRDAEHVLTNLTPVERDIVGKNGRTYIRRVLPYRTADNRIDGVVVTFVDVSQRRRAEAALRESETRSRQLIEGVAQAFWETDATGAVVADSPTWREYTGQSFDQWKGYGWVDAVHPDDRAHAERQWREAVGARRQVNAEFRLRSRDGGYRWTNVRATPMTDDGGAIVKWVAINIDVHDRKEAEAKLREAKEAAEAANRLKDEFLATLSHELRTPLSAILLWTRILQGDEAVEPARLAEGLRSIHDSAVAQKELIEDLLDLSRITMGTLRLHVRVVELLPLVRDAVDAIRPTANARRIALTTELSPRAGTVVADPDRVRQVLWNLLTNALKFTPEHGAVDVSLRRFDGSVEIRVRDTGIGIAADFIEHVFERFRQADASHTRAQGGMGLGLAIAKQLVESHGGNIGVESAGAGQGATFIVRLPLPKVPDHAGDPDGPGASAAGHDVARLKGKRVLLVDDDPAIRSALRALLTASGMVAVEADSSAAAQGEFTRQRPDLIIADIGLSREDGYVMIRKIRAAERRAGAPQVPAIALTAFARETDKRVAIEAGFQMHLGKPVDTVAVLEAALKVLPA